MSDLHRAVEDEIDAFRPDRTPPFGALLDRHRSRNHCRTMVAVAAPVLAAVLVAPVAWSAATGGGDELVQQAGPAPDPDFSSASEQIRYSLTYADAATFERHEQAVDECFALPGVSDLRSLFSLPPTTAFTVTGTDEVQAFAACTTPLDGVLLVEVPADPTRYTLTYDTEAAYGEHMQAVEACLDLTGVADVDSEDRMPPLVGFTVTGTDQNAAIRTCVSRLGGVTLSESPPRNTIPADGPTPQEPDPNGTRYAITSQDASALGRHEQAIQDCFGLPGVSRVFSDGFVASDGTVAVAGADENAAFLDCMNQLEGVTVEERPGVAPPSAWPDTDPPPGRKYVPAPFAAETISADRRSVTVRVAGIAGGCTGQAYGRAVETAEGIKAETLIDVPLDDSAGCRANLPILQLTVSLPRPLAADETVLGQCEPNEATPEGRQCSAAHSFQPPAG